MDNNIYLEEYVLDAFHNLQRIIGCEDIRYALPNNNAYDYNVTIKGIDFAAITKKTISPSNSNFVLDKLCTVRSMVNLPMLLITKSINPKLKNQFSEKNINVLDSAGNSRILADMLYIHISGEKNKLAKDEEKSNKAFNAKGLRLVFFLLQNDQNVNMTYRELSELTEVSIGTVKNVFDELKAQNFILVSKKGRFIKNKSELIQLWQMNYNMNLKPKLLLKRYSFISNEDRDRWKETMLPKGMYWGGEGAAYIVNGFLHPESHDIYSDKNSLALLKTGKFKPSENGEVKVYKKFWTDDSNSQIVPNLLIYADLMGSGDSRCLEAAKKIYNDEIQPF